MPTKKDKPKLTKEELSRIRSEAGKKGAKSTRERGHFRGGRPKGATNKNPLIGLPSKSMNVREPDYNVFVRCAHAANVPLVEFRLAVKRALVNSFHAVIEFPIFEIFIHGFSSQNVIAFCAARS